jgi:hypothetical protein
MRGSAAVRVRLQGVDDTGNSLRARLDGHGGLQRDADPVHRGNGGQQRNVSGRAAAARSRHVAENPRIFAPKNVSWELNVLYDAPCARREPVRRQGGDRLAGIHRPSAGTRADRGGLSAVERACAWSDQLHVPLTTGPTDSSQVPGASGRPVLRKAAWPMLGHDFALLAAVVVSLVGIGSEVITQGQVRQSLGGSRRCGGSPRQAVGRRRKYRRPGTPRSSYPAAARIGISDGTDEGFTMPACRSMIGLAANPGTAVLPMCSISRTRWPSAARSRVVSCLAWTGQAESYGTTCDTLVEGRLGLRRRGHGFALRNNAGP